MIPKTLGKTYCLYLLLLLVACQGTESESTNTDSPPVIVRKLKKNNAQHSKTPNSTNKEESKKPPTQQPVQSMSDTSIIEVDTIYPVEAKKNRTPQNSTKKTGQERMRELRSDPKYQKNNGSIRRLKVAKKLNQEGYRKSNGNRYTLFDIPNSP